MIDIAKVTQMLKSPAIAIVAEDDQQISKMVDDVIRVPMVEETIFSVPAILPGQLLPYYCSVEQGEYQSRLPAVQHPALCQSLELAFPSGHPLIGGYPAK